MTRTDNLPARLQESGLFCCWRREQRRGRATKIPYDPKTDKRAKSNDPATFAPLDVAKSAADRYDGLGVGVFGDLGAIDIDHCINEAGEISEMALDIMTTMDAYTEYSPSRKGLRLLFLAPGFLYDKSRYYTMNAKAGLEIYIAGCTSKFVTVTGEALAPLDLEKRGKQLAAVLEKYMGRPTRKNDDEALDWNATVGGGDRRPSDLDDAALIEKAKKGQNGADFAALWVGDASRYGSHSEADIALVNALVWWTNGDAGRVDRLFRRSGLMREKWDRPQSGSTYGAITIQNAISTRTGGYDPETYRAENAKRDFADTRKPILRPISTVEPKQAAYLIKPYLPKGMVAVMGGVSGVGKTWLILSWAAAVSRGEKLPFMDPLEARPESGYVYYFTQENDPSVVIRPRLDLLGADPEKVLIQSSEGGYDPITMNDPRLEVAAKEYPPALVIFDPIQSYLGTGADMNKANEVRPILDWLGDYAKRHGCTVILISHMSKPGLGNTAALDRLLGSSDFRNAARSIIIVGRDPDDKDSRVFAHDKNSIGQPGGSQRYHIDSHCGVVYDGPCDLTADEIVKAAAPKSNPRQAVTLTEAIYQLDDLLGDEGATTLEAVETLQTLRGIAKTTMYRARQELALQTVSIGKPPKRKTWWVRDDVDVEWFKLTHTEDEPTEQLDMTQGPPLAREDN